MPVRTGFPPPLAGGGWGEGAYTWHRPPSPPTPSRKGRGETGTLAFSPYRGARARAGDGAEILALRCCGPRCHAPFDRHASPHNDSGAITLALRVYGASFWLWPTAALCTQRRLVWDYADPGGASPGMLFNDALIAAIVVSNRRSPPVGINGCIAGLCRSGEQQCGGWRGDRHAVRAAQERPALLVGCFHRRQLLRFLHRTLPGLACRCRHRANRCMTGAACITRRGKPQNVIPDIAAPARRVEAASSKAAAGAVTAKRVARERNARRPPPADGSAAAD